MNESCSIPVSRKASVWRLPSTVLAGFLYALAGPWNGSGSTESLNLGWEYCHPYPTAEDLMSIAYGNGRFVAVAGNVYRDTRSGSEILTPMPARMPL